MRAKRKLAQGRSSRWAFLDKFEVPEYDGVGTYLTRYRLIRTPWFGIYLHRFTGPDPRPTLHDHPWTFRSLVLRGGYVERRLHPITLEVNEHHVVKRYNKVRAQDAHSILKLLRIPTWTFMLTGKDVRQWGYMEPIWLYPESHDPMNDPTPANAKVWKWTPFYAHLHAVEFDTAIARRKALRDA